MLALLCGQLVCFVISVQHIFVNPQKHSSRKYTGLLFGGVGFLLFGTNGMLAAPYVGDGGTTKYLGLLLYLLGMALLALGLHIRKTHLLSKRATSPNNEGDHS